MSRSCIAFFFYRQARNSVPEQGGRGQGFGALSAQPGMMFYDRWWSIMMMMIVPIIWSSTTQGEEECGGVEPVALSVVETQRRSLNRSIERCGTQRRRQCPQRWAVTCLDHFNCDGVLADATEPLRRALGARLRRGSECLTDETCRDEQHLVVNANLMNQMWAEVLPESIILVNLEQLVAVPRDEALTAARRAVNDPSDDVRRHAHMTLAAEWSHQVLGVTVDDYRQFVAIDPVAKGYPWLDYSYRNIDVAANAGWLCFFAKPLGTLSSSSAPESHSIPVDVAGKETLRFDFLADDTPTDITRRAEVFAGTHHLKSGAGCLDDPDCAANAIARAARFFFFFAANTTQSSSSENDDDDKVLDAVHLGGHDVVRRRRILDELGGKVQVLDGIFGAQRAHVLAKTKIGLNVHRHEQRRVAEVLRLLTYAQAGLPTVSETGTDDILQSEFRSCVLFVPYGKIASCTAKLLADPGLQARMRRNAKRLAAHRQERVFLRAVLSALFPACPALVPSI